MLSFREFIEEHTIPVVYISKNQVDLAKESTRNELNRNLAASFASEISSPYVGWTKLDKILAMYHIIVPRINFEEGEDGEYVLAISQFGGKFGASMDGTITSPNEPDQADYFLYYSYALGGGGFYKATAVIVDEEELDTLIPDHTENIDSSGNKDPRQPTPKQ